MQEIEYNALLPFATEAERQCLEALMAHGDQYAAGKALGKHQSTISRSLARVRKRAARSGIAAQTGIYHPAPDGYFMPKTTVQVGADGKVIQQWARYSVDADRLTLAIDALRDALTDEVEPRKPVAAHTGHLNDDLCNVFVLTDYHLGMSAWAPQTGADWDIQIAEDMLVNFFGSAIVRADNAHTAVLAQLGDFFHYDSLTAVTPASGHILDADTRYQKMIGIGTRALNRIVQMLLETHEHVHVICAEGNHDEASSAWLREVVFPMVYADEPRLSVDKSPDPYYCYEWGKTSLFFHHGHKKKPNTIDDVFASKFRDVFGRTKFSYAHMGHMHHYKGLETNLMIVEQYPTLAAADAYASSGGWLSRRSAQCITYHKQFGHWSRVEISADQLDKNPCIYEEVSANTANP